MKSVSSLKKRVLSCLIVLAFCFAWQGVACAAGRNVPKSLVRFTEKTLVAVGENPVVQGAVESQNGQGMTLDAIKAKDVEWKASKGVEPYMAELMNSACAMELMNFQKQHKYILEIFVMDNQGANVAMTNKTSDYWQGDEAKFIESFKGGAGAIHYGDVEFDESAKGFLVQISVPVKKAGAVIGAITFGVSIDEWENR